jgi:SAM-dependent methyltransferase
LSAEKDYVLGTHDEEIERLSLQHRIWRPRALDAWRRAGFTTGQTILDLGCGPGYASLDLAEIVGSSGRVIAVDRSRRFLDALEAAARVRKLSNIEVHELDLDERALPVGSVDGAWARWIFAFVSRPRALLDRVASKLRPGGAFVAHEYFAYATWKLMPRLPELEELVRTVTESWRAGGGEPDIGLEIPVWLEEMGFVLRELNPVIEIVAPSNFFWQWPKTFIEVGLGRLVELGRLTGARAREIRDAFVARESDPRTLLVTPGVLEIIAAKSGVSS